MEIIIYLLIFAVGSFIFYIIGQLFLSDKQLVGERMNSIKTMYSLNDDEDEMKKPFVERVINPIYQKLITILGSMTPASIKKKYEKMIVQAGVSKSTTVSSIIAIQIMLALLVSGILYLLFSFLGGKPDSMLITLAGILGFFIPYVLLNGNATKRQEKIQKALPDLLDLLYISVEAGLGFDMAMKRSTEKMPGPLSDELSKALDDISKGRDRQDALRGVVTRTGVEDLNTFITAVIQSEQLGSNIASMLRIQSTVMRQKRRQRAEEAAMKIPIKMLFPLVLFMFPALFVVILGPAIISIMENLGNL